MTLLLCVCMVFGLTACGGFTQDDIDNAVNSATADLNAEISKLEADIAEKEAKITTLEGEKAALTTEKGELEADITALEAEKADLEADKAELEDEVETLEAEKKALADENAELEASITAKNTEIATLNSSISALETEKANLEDEVETLEASITAKNTEIATLTSSVTALETEKATLTTKVSELEETIATKNSEIATLNSSVATLTEEKATLTAKVSELNAEIATLNERIAELEASGEADKAEIAELKAKVSDLESEKETLTARVTELEGDVADKNAEIEALEADVATLTSEKATLTTKVSELEGTITTKNNEIATLNSSVTTLTEEKTTLNARITELEGNIADKNAEIADLEADVATLTSQKATLEEHITTLNGTITTKNNEIATLNSSISALETEKADLEEQVTSLEASISDKNTEIQNLNSSVATLTAEKQTLTDRVAALEAENEALESEKSELEKENETLKNCVKGNHSGTLVFTSTNDGTQHTATYSCCGTTVTEDHSENTTIGQTCLGYKCVVCGAWYGDKAADNHASDEFTYTANTDGTTHTKAYPCCGTVVSANEAHTITTWTQTDGEHTDNCANCDASVSGECEMDTTTGKCKVCDTLIAQVSVTSGETVTYYSYVIDVLNERASVLKSGDTMQLLTDVADYFNAIIPEGVTFDGGNFTLNLGDYTLENNGTIAGGAFTATLVENNGTIAGGAFTATLVENNGTIAGGTFNDSASNYGTITGGTFNGDFTNRDGSTITGGNFNDIINLYESSTISGDITVMGLMFSSTFDPERSLIDLSNATFGYFLESDSVIILFSPAFDEWNLNNGALILREGYCVFAYDSETDDYIHYTETMNGEIGDYLIRKHSHTLDGYGYDGENHWKTCSCGYADVAEAHTFNANSCICGAIQITDVNAPNDADHPFGDGWSNDAEVGLDSEASIGTQDVGKTAWVNEDQIIVTLISETIGTQTCVLTYNGSNWTLDGSFVYAEGETPTVTAVYAPSSTLGMGDYIPANCTFADGSITINFNGVTCDYSRLRIVGLPNQTLTVTTTGFTPAGATSEATEAYTLTTDDNGNAFLYGTFAEGATVSVKSGNVVLKDYTFTAENNPNGTEQGKSYALDARPVIDGTFGGKTEASEDDVAALVEKIKYYVDNGITTITVTGSNPAMITVNNVSVTAIGEAIYRLSGSGTHNADNQYNGRIDLILSDVTEIVDWEFQRAYALNSINLPKVTTIGTEGIQFCLYLQKLTFGSVVTSIKDGSDLAFCDTGASVGGCDLVLNAGQVNAATEYQPNVPSYTWWSTTWKVIELI